MREIKDFPPLVGGDLLGLITSGMYNNPLAMYREYIQNAADAMAGIERSSNNIVEVSIDPTQMRVKIRDYGPGLSREDSVKALPACWAQWERTWERQRFSRIGRLSALAFAESVVFLTRSSESQPVTRIVWHSKGLNEGIYQDTDLAHCISECVEIETISGSKHPPHFLKWKSEI